MSPTVPVLDPAVIDVVDASLDAVFAMDGEGLIVHLNPTAEQVFGLVAADVIGREMADVIVPQEHREAHRKGLARHRAGGAPTILGRRIEIEGLDSSGNVLPVELTITRIGSEDEPLFVGYVRDLSERVATERELHASRQRLIEASDTARRRIERDLHDGAQQRLIAAGIALKLAEGSLPAGSDGATAVNEAGEELDLAISELRDLARGVHPAVLERGGLKAALRALVRRTAIPVALSNVPEERLGAATEATIYFTVSEALTNVARHSGADSAEVSFERDADVIRVVVADDGRGGAALGDSGTGLSGLSDRAVALGGRLWLESPRRGGTKLFLELPCA